MPELPEVETVVRTIAPHLTGPLDCLGPLHLALRHAGKPHRAGRAPGGPPHAKRLAAAGNSSS